MRSDTRGRRGRGSTAKPGRLCAPPVRVASFLRVGLSVTSPPAPLSGGHGASLRCPIIMRVRVEARRKSFGAGISVAQEQGRNSGVAQAVRGSRCADPKENHIFVFQLPHNRLFWSKFCSLTVYRGLQSAQKSRLSCSFDIFASLPRLGSQLEFPPCSAVQFGSAICAIISDLILTVSENSEWHCPHSVLNWTFA